MPATINDINEGIKTRLATVAGLRVYDYQPDVIYPTIAYPTLTSIDYHKAMAGGMQTYTYNITIIIGRTDERAAQQQLHDYASYGGASSIRAALEADKTLGGIVDTLIVSNSANVSAMQQGDNQFLMLDFTATVYG